VHDVEVTVGQDGEGRRFVEAVQPRKPFKFRLLHDGDAFVLTKRPIGLAATDTFTAPGDLLLALVDALTGTSKAAPNADMTVADVRPAGRPRGRKPRARATQ